MSATANTAATNLNPAIELSLAMVLDRLVRFEASRIDACRDRAEVRVLWAGKLGLDILWAAESRGLVADNEYCAVEHDGRKTLAPPGREVRS